LEGLDANAVTAGPPLPADPLRRLQLLQDAAEHRAFQAHRAGEAGGDKQDASFNRNARLAATIARVRLALTKARAEADPGGTGGEGSDPSQTTIYRLPENGR
jgi:hypothetical protein